MQQKDKTTKLLEDYGDVFSDILNTLLFQKPIINKDMLKPGPTESIYKMNAGKLHAQQRDILKTYDGVDYRIASFGIENQTSIDENMIFRIMSYDSATYMEQVKQNLRKTPVITIVLNFSNQRWKEKSLHETLVFPEYLEPYVSNYVINVFDIAFLDDETIDSFSSDFKHIAKLLKSGRTKEENPIGNYGKVHLEHPQEFCDMLQTFFPKERIYMNAEKFSDLQKGDFEMRDIFEEFGNEKIKEGIEQSLNATLKIMKNLNPEITFEEFCEHIFSQKEFENVSKDMLEDLYNKNK